MRLELPQGALLVPLAMGIAGAVMTVGLIGRGARPPKVPWIVVGAMTVTYGGVLVWVLPALEQQKVVPDVARWVATRAAGSDRVASYRLNRWNTAFRFYVGRHVAMIDAPDEARALFNGDERFFCTMLRPAYDTFVAEGAAAAHRLRARRDVGDVGPRPVAPQAPADGLRGRDPA